MLTTKRVSIEFKANFVSLVRIVLESCIEAKSNFVFANDMDKSLKPLPDFDTDGLY